jgi:cyclopropane-fatty-acyl-phospholipid synthase
MSFATAINLAERGLVPTSLIRLGIRKLLRQRLADRTSAIAEGELIAELVRGPVALQTDKANEQHYEVPPEFFQLVLGPNLKYSSAYWPDGVGSLGEAEESMLALTCERADLADGQDVLELGCGWGSLSLYMAHRFPNSRIVAVSNSASQRNFIERQAPANLEVITADMNDFAPKRHFDRVVSVEMFEHMRNHSELLKRVARWLRADGSLFVHVFCHCNTTYPFETEGPGNWMGRYFFTGGIMPSFDLLPRFDDDLVAERQWAINGRHYQRTAAGWRENLERHKDDVLGVLSEIYGGAAERWYRRWRMFFLACEELFGYGGGDEWLVGHYRFVHRASDVTRGRHDHRVTREDASWRTSEVGGEPRAETGSSVIK